jgi:uncharacterized protein (DUF433 family)
MQQVEAINLIGIDPTVRSGRPFILGTTITVADIVIAKVFKQQQADAIAEDFQIELAQVYAALAYYYQHKATIDASIKERRQLAEQFKEQRLGSRHKPLFG